MDTTIQDIMSPKPVTLHPQATVMDAIHVFNTRRISCIPVVDADQRPVGLLSWRDILKSLEQ